MKRIGLRDGQSLTFNVRQFDTWEASHAEGNNYWHVVYIIKVVNYSEVLLKVSFFCLLNARG
jgi:hypothetical protein